MCSTNVETLKHFIMECPANDIRNIFMNDLKQLLRNPSMSQNELFFVCIIDMDVSLLKDKLKTKQFIKIITSLIKHIYESTSAGISPPPINMVYNI